MNPMIKQLKIFVNFNSLTKALHFLLFIMGLLSLILAMGGCKGTSPRLQTVVPEQGSVDTPAEFKSVDLTPKVDIVFVMDYSTSMRKHQTNLSKNIKHFVAAFEKNKNIDFHISVLPIYDSYHFNKSSPQRHTMIPRFGLGEFLALKDPNAPECDYASDPICTKSPVLPGERFVHKNTPQYLKVLERTLLMGEDLGPAFEESFSPVFPALTGQVLVATPLLTNDDVAKDVLKKNAGFFRGSDAHLILGFITDGDDASDRISPGDLAQALVTLKSGDAEKVSSFAVVAPKEESQCVKDPGGPNGPVKIREFLRLTRSQNFEMSLCSPNFGQKLAKIGSDLAVRVKKQTIDLERVPDFNPQLPEDKKFKVFYGDQLIAPSEGKNLDSGWTYDPKLRRVIIGGSTELEYNPVAKFRVQYTPISTANAINGRVKSH